MQPESPHTLWIVGTSVSIEHDGYVARLAPRARERGFALGNLSIGDQTSLMGCMRLMGVCASIRPGDVVVWEYSLLDTLLTVFDPHDVHFARRLAWREALARGARVIVLLVAPKTRVRHRSSRERRIVADARSLGLPCIDTRELALKLGIANAASHYRDDRHLRRDSPLIDAIAAEVAALLTAGAPSACRVPREWARARRTWRWLDIAELGADRATVRKIENSLVSLDALALMPGDAIALPPLQRLVAVGCVSTHGSGGVWCGHATCRPASTRLPQALGYDFLLRTSGIACRNGHLERLVSAPAEAYRRGAWRDYGQEASTAPGEVLVFGALVETAASPADRWLTNLHSRKRAAYEFLRRFV